MVASLWRSGRFALWWRRSSWSWWKVFPTFHLSIVPTASDSRRRHRASPRGRRPRRHHRRARGAEAHRVGLPRPLSLSRRHASQHRGPPEEGHVLLLRVPRGGERLLLLYEEAGDGLS